VQLAGQMQQLQMHELAEAVLARARRQAGSRPPALAALLAQYQTEGKTDVAVQVANQILRATMPSAAALQDTADVTARAQALQVLSRSGKLSELIARLEHQLQSAPRSTYLLQMLVETCEASGDLGRIRSAYERLAQRNPDDPGVRYEVGKRLIQRGDAAAALPHLTAALRRQPSLYANNYYQIVPALQQANKLEELTDALEAGNLRAVSLFPVSNLINALLAQDPTRPRGLKLLAKAWQVFPEQRPLLLQQLSDDKVWKLPDVLAYGRQVLLPQGKESLADPWFGLQDPTPRLLQAGTPKQLAALAAEVEPALRDRPDWRGGKALQALVYARQNQPDRARPVLVALLADADHPLPLAARLLLGTSLEPVRALQDLTLRLNEGGVETALADAAIWLDGSPIPQLIALYQKAGRAADARALALRAAAVYGGREVDPDAYSGNAQVQGNSILSLAESLLQLGYPVDALRLYLPIANSPDPNNNDYRWANRKQQAENGVVQCMQSFRPESLEATLRSAFATEKRAPDAPPLDLMVVSHPQQVDQARLRSLLGEALQSAGEEPALLALAQGRLADLRRQYPHDCPVHVAEVLLTLPRNRADESRAVVERLLRLVEASPLEALPPGTRANARQRAEALPQVSLWLAARECARDHDLGAAADRLASRALEAARRQAESGLVQALLREAGLLALEQGDRVAAEAYWSELLERTLALAAMARATKGPAAAGVPALTNVQFKAALEIAVLAANHRLGPLSVRAVKTALRGGPPVAAAGEDVQRQYRPFAGGWELSVEQWLVQLDGLWRDAHVEPTLEYEALVEAVLPEGRPTEVFLYPRPLDEHEEVPRRLHSVGALLARRAVEAGREDDLLRRLAARQGQPLAALPARVLQTQLGLAAKRPTALEALREIAQRMEKESLPVNVELACHAALPALADGEAAPVARTILERVAARAGPSGVLAFRALARDRFQAGDQEAGRKFLLGLLKTPPPPAEAPERAFRPRSRDTANDSRLLAASEFARAGLWADVWDMAGRIADKLPSAGEDRLPAGLWEELTRQAAALPAARRCAHWKAWSMPTSTRRSIRAYHAFAGEQANQLDGGGEFLSSLRLLVEAGRLEELSAELTKLAEARVENAAPALLLAQVLRGPGPSLEKDLDAFQAELTRRHPKAEAPDFSYPRTPQPFPWADYLVARACLDNPNLRRRGDTLARALLNDPTARPTILRDLADDPAALDLLIQVQETELEETLTRDSNGNPVGSSLSSLLALYRGANRVADGRAAALRFFQILRNTSLVSVPDGNQPDLDRQRRESLLALAEGLVELGYPADAVPVYRAALSQPTGAAKDADAENQQDTDVARSQLTQTLAKLKSGQGADVLKAWLGAAAPADPPARWIALVRRWADLPAAQRYARLESWSLSGGSSVRILAGVVPFEEPPPAFRAAKVRGAGHVLSTAQLLVDAAKEAGKLDELAARLRSLAEKKIPNAVEVLVLLQAARGPAKDGPSVEALLEQVDRPAGYPFWPVVRRPTSWPALLVVRACLAQPRLRAAGEHLARRLLGQADPNGSGTALLRRELAVREGGSPPALWRPGTGSGAPEPLGAARGSELRVEAGAGQGSLHFAYPLAGRFECSVETTFEDEESGTLGYAGSIPWPNVLGQETIGPVYLDSWGNAIPLGRRHKPGWHRLTVQVEPGTARFLLDGAVFHEQPDPDPANPFLTLTGPRQGRATFRNALRVGDPEIPRAVSLIHGDRLDAWTGAAYSKRVRVLPRPDSRLLATARFPDGQSEDWIAEDGVLRGRRLENAATPTPSVLACVRPFQAGETVSYEFFCQPGEEMVHPALGRLAFLLEPGGVRLHWLGNFPLDESLGIKADNAVVEADCRRGPAELPLKAGAWNRAELSLDARRLRVSLNGVLVYEKSVATGGPPVAEEPTGGPSTEASAGRSFGLFHYQDRTAARVRNVVLTGDWPRKLREAQRRDLLAPADSSDGERR
jgi:hypothetical protein